MKYKAIAALAMLGGAGAALAQSSVTLYGSMDLTMPWISDVRGSRLTRMDSAISQPDLWGLRGSEDLGGGMKASFQLENGFLTDIGSPISPTSYFNRASWVGLDSASMGSVRLGRQVDFTAGTLSQWGNGYQLYNFYLYHPGNLDGLSSQFPVDNSVVYLTPSMGGMQFGAQYGFGEVPGRSQANRTYSVMGSYSSVKLNLAVAYTDARGRAFDIAGRTGLANALGQDLVAGRPLVLDTFQVLGIGGGYQLDALPVRLNALLTRSTLKYGGASSNMSALDLGLAWQTSQSVTINTGYSFSRFEQTKWNQVHLGARYAFSKRTQLHASVTHQRASDGVAAMNSVGVASGRTQTVIAAGIHHSF